MPQWTQEQNEAIHADNAQLLVSAAAGSGKTAVLIERILRLLNEREDARLDRMVIVTFTKAAAAQLREKLHKRLFEDSANGCETAAKQLALLPVTQIGTIHSFCTAILKEQFQVVGLDPGIKQIDSARREKLVEKAFGDALDACYEQATPAFESLSGAFSDGDIQEMALKLYAFMMSLRDPFAWLEKQATSFYTEETLLTHPFADVLLNGCRIQLAGLDGEMAKLLNEMASPYADAKWLPTLKSDEAHFERLKAAAKKGCEALLSECGHKFERVPVLRNLQGEEALWHEEMKKKREWFKSALKKVLSDIPVDFGQSAADLNRMQPCLEGLKEVTIAFYTRFQAAKQQENGMDFNDLIQLTLQVLKNEEARKTIQNQYDHLFVDEYQDVGDAEEGIFQAIWHEGNHLFMVGDVKQSIYRFRLCDPTLFLHKQETFSMDENAPCRKIFLNRNFRSEPQVLETVNRVFETVMMKRVTELDYDAEAHLYPGREEGPCEKPRLIIVPGEKQRDEDGNKIPKNQGEFEALAELILAQREKKIYDGELKQMRLTRFRDMAILLPKAKGVALELAAFLKEYGIPAYADSDEAYFELPEVQRMMALLTVLDNPRNDLMFLTVLKLPLFHFTDEELADIRLGSGGKGVSFYDAFNAQAKTEGRIGLKCLRTLERLNIWRFHAAHMPLDQLVWEVMKESGLYLLAGTQQGGHVRQGNLRLLCEYAANYQAVGHGGLDGFLRLGVQIGDEGDTKTAKALSPKDDLVRIMTIHKSKGLEFPVVYMTGLGNALHMAEKAKLCVHKELGIGILYVSPELRIKRKTMAQRAIAAKNELEDRAERARLLYVGMTRAVEKLVLIGTADKLPADEWERNGEYGVLTAKSYLDWLCITPDSCEQICKQLKNPESTGFPQGETPYDISVWASCEARPVETQENVSTGLSTLQGTAVSSESLTARRLENAFFINGELMPLKTSVSAISKNAAWSAQEETVATKAAEEMTIPPLTMSDLPALPSFMQEKALCAADRGSAVHMVLSQLRFTGDIQAELDKMQEKGLLDAAQRKEIPLKWLEGFAKSDLCKRMQAAKRVKREWAFTHRLYENKPTLVQGVMDLCFLEEDGWVLCDYKTDRACDAKTLLEHYEKQLHIYKQALGELTGIPVKEAWLFALRSGEAIKVASEGII